MASATAHARSEGTRAPVIDKLGVLIMADVPNWWGPPTDTAFREHDSAMREMIARDYNHPAVFSWIVFNESWGLTTKAGGKELYLPATQRRVVNEVRIAKSLDSSNSFQTRSMRLSSISCP